MQATRKFTLMASVVFAITSAGAQDFAPDSLTLAGGGGTSTGRVFAVTGTIGQMDTARMVGSRYAVDGGFWSALLPVIPPPENLATNGGFENDTGTFVGGANGVMSLPTGSTLIPGWTSVNAELAWVAAANSYGPSTPHGAFFLDLTGFHDSPPYGGIARTLSTVSNQQYRLSFSLGAYPDLPSYRGPMTVAVLVAGNSNVFTFTPPAPAAGNQWKTFGWEFTATSNTTAITVTGSAATGGLFLGLDNLSLFSQTSGLELLTNGGFEDLAGTFWPDPYAVMVLPAGATTIPGWTTAGSELVWGRNSNFYGLDTPFGAHFLDLTGYLDVQPYGGVAQTIATEPGLNYHLAFSLGVNQDVAAYRGPVSALVQAGSSSSSFTFTPGGSRDEWAAFSLDFTATSDATPIAILGVASGGGQYLGLDNISVMPVGARSSPDLLQISSASIAGLDLRLQFFGEAGRTYAIESRTNVATGAWIPVPGTTNAGLGGVSQVTLTNALDQPQQFYRMRRLP